MWDAVSKNLHTESDGWYDQSKKAEAALDSSKLVEANITDEYIRNRYDTRNRLHKAFLALWYTIKSPEQSKDKAFVAVNNLKMHGEHACVGVVSNSAAKSLKLPKIFIPSLVK